MNLKKCDNGHFYDADTYPSCPHCGVSGGHENFTVPFSAPPANVDVTIGGSLLREEEQKTVDMSQLSMSDLDTPKSAQTSQMPSHDDEVKTISIWGRDFDSNEVSSNGVEEHNSPVVGWLVCVSGANGLKGRDFKLKVGRNFIGRDNDMDVCLKNESSVSRQQHAIIIYEPKQNIFLAQPGNTKELTYLNDEVVLVPQIMKKNDVLQVGNVALMLVPFCDDAFKWEL